MFGPLPGNAEGPPLKILQVRLEEGTGEPGEILDVNAEGIDVYNTMLGAMGCKEQLGPGNRKLQRVDQIRA